MEITGAIRDYIHEKITKHDKLLDKATSIRVECTQHVAARGVSKDFRVELLVGVPKKVIRVEKDGSDIYALVDEAVDVLVREAKEYKERLRNW